MKLCRFGNPGSEKPGAIDEDGAIRDLSTVIPDLSAAAISDGTLARLRGLDLRSLPSVNGTPRLGIPVNGIGKIVCAGMNYSDHCIEAGFPIPEQPALFMKATSALSGPVDDIVIPPSATQVDWEIELAVVIGRRTNNVAEADALDAVVGYTILNDVSDRDFQFNHGGQWFKGKSADSFCPVGPWLVTTDEIADPQTLDMHLDVNGRRMQTGTTANMIFGVAALISHISRYMTLMPGDLVSTGTPPGVGMGQKPPVYLKAGDTLRAAISGLGEQRSAVTDRIVEASAA